MNTHPITSLVAGTTLTTATQISIHAENASTGADGVRSAQRTMSRKIRAMRSQELHRADFAAPMEEILRDEERRDAE